MHWVDHYAKLGAHFPNGTVFDILISLQNTLRSHKGSECSGNLAV